MAKTFSFLFALMISLIMMSCGQNKVAIKKTDTVNQPPITIQSFSKFPPEIDGCSCYFSANEKAFKQHQYLIVTNLDSLAFMTINEKPLKFKLLSSSAEPQTFTTVDHVEIFGNNDYTITIDIKHKKSSDSEVWIDEGIITITRKDGQKLVKQFYGECGC
jgi:hypothetical protein